MSRILGTSLLVCAAFCCSHSQAADGVLEINQACALNGGCFSGDSAGFPVTIDGSAGRSYRLTGDLDLSGHPTVPAISIAESFITLELNGFQIAGATTCEPEPLIASELICAPENAGAHGIELIGQVRSVTIRNGFVRGMPDDGLVGAEATFTQVENITFSENAGWGASLGDRSQIRHSRAESNGSGGFSVQDDSNISNCQVYGNDGVGVQAGIRAIVSFCNSEAGFSHRAFEIGTRSKYSRNAYRGSARCGGGVCTERKRYYLTQSLFYGNQVLGACESGFHTAAIYEIHNVGNFEYDEILGWTGYDTGSGPPSTGGWIRSGIAVPTGSHSCSSWGSDSDAVTGTYAYLTASSWDNPSQTVSPWQMEFQECHLPRPVWCVEN